MNLLPAERVLPNVLFQSTKYRNKELCVDNKLRETIGDVYCPTCRNEKCVYNWTNKTTIFYDCIKCRTCSTFWVFLLRTKNRQCYCLAVTVRIVLQEIRVATTKKKSHLHFWRNFSANHNQAHPNLIQKRLRWVQIWKKRIRFLLVDDLSDIFIFQIIFFNFNLQSTATQIAFNLQKNMIFSVSNEGIQWILDSRFWFRLCYYCSKWYRPKLNNQLTRNTPSSLALAVVSKTKLFEQSSSASSNYFQPTRNIWNERRSTLHCGGSRLGHQWLSSVRSRGYRFQLGKFTVGHGRSVQTRHRHPLFSNNIWRFIDGRCISWKPHCVGWRGWQGKCSSSNNTRVCQTHRTSQAAKKSRFWSTNEKCTR